MSSLITEIIPPQAHELIRDRIGAILAVEIANQVIIDGDYEMDADVYVERSKPFDKTEVPAVNVSLARGSYDSQNQGNTRGTYAYNIDVYTAAKNTEDIAGDVRSAFKLQKLIGWCRFILEHPVYTTLSFDPPFISHRSCAELSIKETVPEDATSQCMGRLSLTVVANNAPELLAAAQINSHYTTVKLSATNKGYLFIIDDLA